MNDMKQACCPFCGSDDISAGEVMTASDQGFHYTQSECQGCGALGPRAELPPGDIDYGDVKAIAAWNRRTQPEATKPAQDLSAAILALPFPPHVQGNQAAVMGYTAALQDVAALASSAAICQSQKDSHG